MTETLVKHVELRLMVDKKRLRECLRRLERGGGVGDARESRAALEDLANLVNENPALMVARELRPYVDMLRTLLKERAQLDTPMKKGEDGWSWAEPGVPLSKAERLANEQAGGKAPKGGVWAECTNNEWTLSTPQMSL